MLNEYKVSLMQTAKCPACGSDCVVEEDSYENDLIDCANCGAQSEIASLHPLRLRKLEEE
ncbi:lysine biosynthesis protein LysW [Candidatus Falkowbacteria bacterium]|nr:lysine biosynthesis protein LysW [Candidatus Falkowbacteria bacterium]